MAIGLLKPDSGHIYTLGEDVTQMSEEALFELRRKARPKPHATTFKQAAE